MHDLSDRSNPSSENTKSFHSTMIVSHFAEFVHLGSNDGPFGVVR